MKFNPAAFFVRRWQFTLVACALLAALGLSALSSIPRSEDPQFPIPTIYIRATLPGGTPAEIEQQVVKPIEDAIDGLDNVTLVRSTSYDGSALLRAEFTWNSDPDRKYDEVVREVNALRPTLPPGVSDIRINRADTTQAVIFEAAVVSDVLPMRGLEKVAHRLRDRIDRLPGVREARYWGATPSEARVALDPGRMARLGLSPAQVTEALRARGAEGPIGAVHAGERRFDVKSGGAFNDLEEIASTPLQTPGGQTLRVGDVSAVAWRQLEADHLTRFNGHRAVVLTATQKPGADVTAITARLNATLAEVRKTLPASVRIEPAFFQADNVKARLDHLFRDFAIALALVMITLIPLGFRASVIVMVSIPLSLLVGLAVLQALGFTLNQLSIAGFVLALGLLVDDSIVVTENIARHLRAGEDRATAAIRGAGEITLAVAGCTACLMLAFLPLLALPEAAGAYIRSLPVSVLSTVGASFLISLSVIPFLASRLLPRQGSPHGNRGLQLLNGLIQSAYRPVLRRALARPWLTLAILGALCLLSVPLLGAIGTSLFPPADTPDFLVRIETPQGASLRTTARALAFAERELAATPKIKWRISNLGQGNPPPFYNVSQHEPDPRYAEVFASFDQWRPHRSDQVLEALRRRLGGYPGARITVVTFENGPVIEAPIAVQITGDNLDVLKDLGAKAEAILKRTPGARDVDDPLRVDRTDLNLGVDEAKAALLGVPVGAVRETVQLALSGQVAAQLRDRDGDSYPVRVRLPMEDRNDLSALGGIYVGGAHGAAPLSAVTTPFLQSSPSRIDRLNGFRTLTVTAFVAPDHLTSAVTQDALARLRRELPLPAGYQLSLGGQAEAQASSFAGLGAAVAIAIFGILAVLILEFGAFKPAIVVAGVIPLGVFGAFAALWVAGYSLSFTAMIGLVALIGIEIKNSILLVDFTEQIRREGASLIEAIERAGEIRFLPVLLTSVTAIGGLLPLAVGQSGLYSPLAVAIMGGLISSTLLSRVATPVMYLLVARGAHAPVRGAHAA